MAYRGDQARSIRRGHPHATAVQSGKIASSTRLSTRAKRYGEKLEVDAKVEVAGLADRILNARKRTSGGCSVDLRDSARRLLHEGLS